MTDNHPDSGTTPGEPGEPTTPESNVPTAPASSIPDSAQPEQAQPEQVQAEQVQAEQVQPEQAQPEQVQPEQAQPEQIQLGEARTEAYPTDAFGQVVETLGAPTPRDAHNADERSAFAQGSPNAGAFNANTSTPSYATAGNYPGQPLNAGPAFTSDKAKEQGRRKGSVALIAALAIGALVGGSSGAGITALMMNGQNNGVVVSQASGPSNVVVNNTKSVNQITAVAAKASPSVVTIDVSSKSAGGTGSGVILSDDGYVLTNTHVVTLDGAASDVKIEVKSNDGKLYTATLVGTDPISDLAVIKLNDASGLTPIVWGDSSALNVGDSAIAIGAPLGLSGTVTDGIVSALNRSITVASSAAPSSPDATTPDQGNSKNPFFFDFPNQDGTPSQGSQKATASIALPVIQTDAAINPGNSGGALLNGSGELIGINVAIASAGNSTSSSAAGSIGVGFSIPSNFAKRISDEIIASGKATHGLLGASVKDASSSNSSTVGALISDVSSGGAAAKAGLKSGDVITNFNGVPITDAIDLTAQVRAVAAGQNAELSYVRNDKTISITVTVGELAS